MERVKNILSENGMLLGVFFKDENKCIGVYDAEADINIYESFAKEIGSDELLEQLETKKWEIVLLFQLNLNHLV